MIERGDGILRLPAQSIDLGRVLAERVYSFISDHPNSESALRRIFTLMLATVREDGEPTRRRPSPSPATVSSTTIRPARLADAFCVLAKWDSGNRPKPLYGLP
jgi:hypothetical protein